LPLQEVARERQRRIELIGASRDQSNTGQAKRKRRRDRPLRRGACRVLVYFGRRGIRCPLCPLYPPCRGGPCPALVYSGWLGMRVLLVPLLRGGLYRDLVDSGCLGIRGLPCRGRLVEAFYSEAISHDSDHPRQDVDERVGGEALRGIERVGGVGA